MKVDLTDLLNASEVAEVLGLSQRSAVGTYRSRYPSFPEPVMVKGTCVLWHRPEVEAWMKARQDNPPKKGRPKKVVDRS